MKNINEILEDILLDDKELLVEMPNMDNDKKSKICVQINPTPHRNGAYFKVYDTMTYTTESRVARINLEKEEYIPEHQGHEVFVLNAAQRKGLMRILNKKNKQLKSLNNYQAMLFRYNTIREKYGLPKIIKNEIPDYENKLPHND